jgi:AraC-like DNA-binding protein
MDALSEILKSIKVRHTAAGTLRLTAPWGFIVKDFEAPMAYGVAEGYSCWLRVPDREAIQLKAGDLVLVNGEHQLLCSPDAAVEDWAQAWRAQGFPSFDPSHEPEAPLHFKWGGGGEETTLLGLAFGLACGRQNPLLESLPPYIVLRNGTGGFPSMPGSIEFLTSRDANSPGYGAMARLLADLIFVSIVRSHLLGELKGTRGWLRGLGDPRIARALQAIHQDASAEWSVGSLAQVAGMSRTAFAVRFAALVEETPIDYLTRWRMHLAADRLLRSRPNLTQLAFDLGYTSDAAFRDAFKRCYGVAPSRFVAEYQGTR